MAQKQAEREQKVTGITVDLTLSEESKRQREGNTGAFGKRTGSSDLLFVEGTLPKDDGEILNMSSIDEQAEVAFDNLESKLSERWNRTLADVMKLEIQLTDPDDGKIVDEIYESRFGDVEFPPRTVVGVCSLPGGADIQLDVIAAEE
jgi:2-iminobutanoate/2-iminopropanoate deaminase